MDSSLLVSVLEGQVLLVAVGMTRLATAFLLLPLFSSNLIPPLIRNSIFVALTLVVLVAHGPVEIDFMGGTQLLSVFVVEVVLGAALGLFFGLFLWAFEAAGEVIDTAIGTSMAMIHDPISGNEVTLFGEFLGRWANYLFMASGGMILITGVVLNSFALWPIGVPLPQIASDSVQIFLSEFSVFFSLMLMLAAPLLLIIFLVDLSMGLVNRFAQQLNVLFLSISIKSILSLVILAMLLPSLTQVFVNELQVHSDSALQLVQSLFQP